MFDPERKFGADDNIVELTDEVLDLEGEARIHNLVPETKVDAGQAEQERLEHYQPPKGWKDKKAA